MNANDTPDNWERYYESKCSKDEVIELADRLGVEWPNGKKRMPLPKKTLIFNLVNCCVQIRKREFVPSHDKRLYHLQVYRRIVPVQPPAIVKA